MQLEINIEYFLQKYSIKYLICILWKIRKNSLHYYIKYNSLNSDNPGCESLKSLQII